jgi:geranylgeranyl pyrophosphate synthase
VELVHTASLLHDDVIDGATQRRGSPSVNARWGNKVSVLAGDHLFACVMRVAARDGTLAMVQSIASVAGSMTEGECAQSLNDGVAPLDESGYLSMIEGKTAFLFSCAAQVGARMGYGGEQKVQALSAFGKAFGMAFQIVDDVLDITGEASVLGKEPGTDLMQGRWTLPFIHALAVLPPTDGDWLRRRFATDAVPSDEDMERLRRLAGASGGLSYSVDRAGRFADTAKARLGSCEPSPSRDALATLVDYMVDRVAAFG